MISPTGAVGVLPGEQCCPRGRALGHRIDVMKLHAIIGECIDVGSFDIVGSVATDPVLSRDHRP